ncbi:ribonuclease HII [Parvularcula sp. LCG005]|uniref:ribonuclease HII n=1 Tax=Parvularcula sp. LCG005 TaxID=3078805 RepID=UPI002943C441|nr:ribonuclease HII [Parvularcula sp. LCG005]WOI53755.1 ribonuclease HII [Parvularcula sp. LCG005]
MPHAEPTLDVETNLAARWGGPVAGIDEAGRGAWAGPVVAAAVILDAAACPVGIRDSKKIPERRRDEIADAIRATSRVGVGIASPAEIDQINILQATFLAMQRAVADLGPGIAGALIDGKMAPDLGALRTETLIKGDSLSLSVAAASIIAKTTRDAIMRGLHADHPGYLWARNKGYGAAAHAAALEAVGPCPHHRQSFAPIARLIR